jgi:hypothetical protein
VLPVVRRSPSLAVDGCDVGGNMRRRDSRTWRILRVELVTIDCLVMARCRWEAEGS